MDHLPAWSPDDRWIAFVRHQAGSGAILLIPSVGGPERTLIEAPGIDTSLSWTPDAKWVAFAKRDSPIATSSIWAISVESGELRRLTSFPSESAGAQVLPEDLWPAISPDGRAVAFSRQVKSFVFELNVLRLTRDLRPDGAPGKIIDQTYADIQGIAWTADSREIVYSAGSRSVTSLWRVAVSGKHAPKRLPYQPAAIYPAIARTQRRLAYAWKMQNTNLWRMDTRTGERKMLIGSTYDSGDPQYSPDGQRIAFRSNRSGSTEIWTCYSDGSNCLQLTSFNGPLCGNPRWSPNGRWLVLDSRAGGGADIYVMAADGGAPRRITQGGANSVLSSWSHDGLWIYFASDRSGRYEIWKAPKDGGEAVQVTHSGGYIGLESPNGRYLYYTKYREGGLFRRSAEGGEEKEVLPGVSNAAARDRTVYFDVTAKGVYFRMPVSREIRFLDAATGKVSTIGIVNNQIPLAPYLCASPDDAYVIWPQLDRQTQDLMLVEGFR